MSFTDLLNNPYIIAIAVAMALVWIVQLWFYLYRYRGIILKNSKINSGQIKFSGVQPPVSVIICSRDNAENLEKNLPAILNQSYGEFQVVVVDDASEDNTQDVLLKLEQVYPNLYHTFLPPGVQNVSTKKMAMTIGLKAAKYDYVIFTDPDCNPVDSNWLSSMVSNVDNKTEVVMGFTDFSNKGSFLLSLVRYDNLFSAIQFMGFAYFGKPYMALTSNLLISKDVFFRNKGFASHLNLTSGEEDLFIRDVANKNNTSISVIPESVLSVNKDELWKFWKKQKLKKFSTYPGYKFMTKLRLGSEMTSRLLFFALFIFFSVYGIFVSKYLLSIFAVSLFLIRVIAHVMLIRSTAKVFNIKLNAFTAIFYDLVLPVINFNLRMKHITQRNDNFTRRVLR